MMPAAGKKSMAPHLLHTEAYRKDALGLQINGLAAKQFWMVYQATVERYSQLQVGNERCLVCDAGTELYRS